MLNEGSILIPPIRASGVEQFSFALTLMRELPVGKAGEKLGETDQKL
jgi:hypothetical protein